MIYLYFAKQSERSWRLVTSPGSEAGPTERRPNAQASASRGIYSQSWLQLESPAHYLVQLLRNLLFGDQSVSQCISNIHLLPLLISLIKLKFFPPSSPSSNLSPETKIYVKHSRLQFCFIPSTSSLCKLLCSHVGHLSGFSNYILDKQSTKFVSFRSSPVIYLELQFPFLLLKSSLRQTINKVYC